jgi:hypothetical protein
MAFLDLTIGTPVARSRSEKRIAAVEPKLGAQERKVVLLARTDPASSLKRSRMSRLTSVLFGIEPPHMLADTRLEALRRYAVLYRVHGRVLSAREIEHARAAGLSDGELARARALIDVAHGAQVRVRGGAHILAMLFGVLMAGLLAFAAASMLATAIDSMLMAAMLTGLAFVSLAPLAAGNTTSRTVYR